LRSRLNEACRDARAFVGTVTIQQPLIAPLYQSQPTHAVLGALWIFLVGLAAIKVAATYLPIGT
jgi:hypothetical protein